MLNKILIFLATVVGMIIAIPVIFFSYMFWSQRPLHGPTFYARVTVDMKVDDQPVHMERIVTCKTVPSHGVWFERQSTEYFSYPLAIGSDLPDGAAVMLSTPYECDREEYTDDKGLKTIRAKQLPSEYVPRIGWTPNSSTMKILEVYIDRDSFKSKNSRIKKYSFHTELIDEETAEREQSSTNDFQWFSGNVYIDREREKYKSIWFSGYYARVLSEEQWRGHSPELDAELDSYTQAQMVERRPELGEKQPRFTLDKLFGKYAGNRSYISNSYRAGGVYSTELSGSQPRRGSGIISTPETRIEYLISEGPMLRVAKNGIWDRLILHRQDRKKRGEKGSPDLQNNYRSPDRVTYIRGDTIISPKASHLPDTKLNPSNFLYDPETKEVFSIHVNVFRAYPAVGHAMLQQSQTK